MCSATIQFCPVVLWKAHPQLSVRPAFPIREALLAVLHLGLTQAARSAAALSGQFPQIGLAYKWLKTPCYVEDDYFWFSFFCCGPSSHQPFLTDSVLYGHINLTWCPSQVSDTVSPQLASLQFLAPAFGGLSFAASFRSYTRTRQNRGQAYALASISPSQSWWIWFCQRRRLLVFFSCPAILA